jgi:hypothetical protein
LLSFLIMMLLFVIQTHWVGLAQVAAAVVVVVVGGGGGGC